MVERPIKRSEQTASAGSQGSEASSEERNDRRDRKKGKGKSDLKGDQEKPPVNLALMRGPRPKPEAKPVVMEESEQPIEEESIAVEAVEEASIESVAEGSEPLETSQVAETAEV